MDKSTPIINIREEAMRYGAVLGIYCLATFAAFRLSITRPMLSLIVPLLFVVIPLLGFYLCLHLRRRVLPLQKGFPFTLALAFGVLTYFFASMLMAAGQYIYFAYMDDGFLADHFTAAINQVVAMQGMEAYASQLNESIDVIAQLTPIQWALQAMWQLLVWGSIFSLITAILLRKKAPARPASANPTNDNQE